MASPSDAGKGACLCVQVEAEKVAWKLAGELGLDVVTILPNFVLVSWQGGRSCGCPNSFDTVP